MRGRKPKPTDVMVLRGNAHAIARVVREPKATKGAPTCPDWLDAEAKRQWRHLVEELKAMRILSTVDRTVLAGLCQNWSLWVRASKALNKIKDLTDDNATRLMTKADNAHKAFFRGCLEFGLTPSSRTRLRTDPMTKKGEGGLAEFVIGGNRVG